MASDRLQAAVEAHDAWADSRAQELEAALLASMTVALARAVRRIRTEARDAGLLEPDGTFARRAASERLIRRADGVLLEELRNPRYDRSLSRFAAGLAMMGATGGAGKQAQFFDRFWSAQRLDSQRIKAPRWNDADRRYLDSRRRTVQQAIDGRVASWVTAATGEAATTAAVTSPEALAETLASSLTGRMHGPMRALAATAAIVHFRAVSDRAYTKLQAGRGRALKYTYLGPVDDRNRPACRAVLSDNAPRTRAEIDRLGEVDFYSGGGFNCRHVWVLA